MSNSSIDWMHARCLCVHWLTFEFTVDSIRFDDDKLFNGSTFDDDNLIVSD